jgi:hypothetical protein
LQELSLEFLRDLWMTFAGLEDNIRGSFRGGFSLELGLVQINQSILRIVKLQNRMKKKASTQIGIPIRAFVVRRERQLNKLNHGAVVDYWHL